MGDERSGALAATFDVADDLLWQAEAGRLSGRGAITVGRSGQIGALVELALAVRAMPTAYASVTVTPPFFNQVLQGLAAGRISGGGACDIAGVFPLTRLDPTGDDCHWQQWASHAENAAVASGLARGLVSGLMGALGELQENVYQHSGQWAPRDVANPRQGISPLADASLRSAKSGRRRGAQLFALIHGNALSYSGGRALWPHRLMHQAERA